MNGYSRQMTNEVLFASTTPGLEPTLLAEARALDAGARAVEGGVELRGPAGLHQRANLSLRTASRVLLRLADFELFSPNALAQALRGAAGVLPRGGEAVLSVIARGGRLGSENAARAAVAQALGVTLASGHPERSRGAGPGRESGHPERSRGALTDRQESSGPFELTLRAQGSAVSLSVDTSGELLYRRGYRQEVSRAPLRETLAAGVLLLAGYTGEEPLVDPLCGSGTFLIEGALLASRRAPGLARAFAFERFATFDSAAYERLKAELRAQGRPRPPALLRGSDLNAGALGTARRNARRAGVLESLELHREDALKLSPPPGPPGLLVANLPYGKRISGGEDVPAFLRAFSGRLCAAAFKGWRAALLTLESDVGALKLPGRPAVHALDNGGLHCALCVAQL